MRVNTWLATNKITTKWRIEVTPRGKFKGSVLLLSWLLKYTTNGPTTHTLNLVKKQTRYSYLASLL